jgi:quercetin dioxygenase-like cupin family protein
MTGVREVAPGELRASSLVGGTSHTVQAGDVLVIPAGVPHWFADVTAPFHYFVVKVG